MLHCLLSGGEFVEDAMLIYINEKHEIVIYGRKVVASNSAV